MQRLNRLRFFLAGRELRVRIRYRSTETVKRLRALLVEQQYHEAAVPLSTHHTEKRFCATEFLRRLHRLASRVGTTTRRRRNFSIVRSDLSHYFEPLPGRFRRRKYTSPRLSPKPASP